MGRRLRDKDTGWKDVVGQPDAWDLKNLQTLINNFNRSKFQMPNGKTITGLQWSKLELEDAKRQHQADDVFNDYGVKIEDSETRIGTAMPNMLWEAISETMPPVFRDKDHFAWFIKNFPQYRVTRKY